MVDLVHLAPETRHPLPLLASRSRPTPDRTVRPAVRPCTGRGPGDRTPGAPCRAGSRAHPYSERPQTPTPDGGHHVTERQLDGRVEFGSGGRVDDPAPLLRSCRARQQGEMACIQNQALIHP
jgi:hypothetical protein